MFKIVIWEKREESVGEVETEEQAREISDKLNRNDGEELSDRVYMVE